MSTLLAIVVLVIGSVSAASPPPDVKSRELARQLTTALTERGLDAVAAQVPGDSDRFVAALYFPSAQLLVISARYATPEALGAKLAQKQYRDIYLDLSSKTDSATSWFLQDMQADGLCASREQVADVLYNGTSTPTIFDTDWNKHDLSEDDYIRMLTEADERYSRLLDILFRQIQGM